MNRSNTKAFTILELLVVVAIIAIIAIIAIPNFIGRIDGAKASQELAEINAVGKAISTYYADNGVYPTLQGKDGTLLQVQPVEGSPHNVDFSSLVPNYLATLPHFSYWWVDAQGKVYHTQETIGSVASGVFTPTTGYSYTLYKTNGSTQALSAPYTLQAGEYIVGKDEKGVALPKVSAAFKNAKVHPESGEVVTPTPLPVVDSYWSATNKVGTVTLSNGNLDAYVANLSSGVKSTVSKSSGKWYLELKVTASDNASYSSTMLGVARETDSDYTYGGAYNRFYWAYDGSSYKANVSATYGAAYHVGAVIGVAIDMDAGTLIFYKNGVSQGVAFTDLKSLGSVCVIINNGSSSGSGSTVRANFGATPFQYSVPSGYKPYNQQ